jgi:hypothetical protein
VQVKPVSDHGVTLSHVKRGLDPEFEYLVNYENTNND